MIPKSDKKATEIVIDMRPLVLCKDCKREEVCCIRRTNDQNWFCADGEMEVKWPSSKTVLRSQAN